MHCFEGHMVLFNWAIDNVSCQ